MDSCPVRRRRVIDTFPAPGIALTADQTVTNVYSAFFELPGPGNDVGGFGLGDADGSE